MKTEKIKNIAVCLVFAVIIGFIFISGIVIKDKKVSQAERRLLAQFPKISSENVMNAKFMKDFEKYSLDQFAFRDNFRGIKANFSFNILQKKDNNKIFIIDDEVYRIEYPLKENEILLAAEKINKVYDMYLKGMNCYYSIIPDKNYFVAADNGYPSFDYKKVENIMTDNIKNVKYISLFDSLTRQDYYKTDTHWRQEKLQNVVNTLGAGMGFTPADLSSYKQNEMDGFKGVYHGQAAVNIPSEKLIYLTNSTLDNSTVVNKETNKNTTIYETDKFEGTDPYNLFLTGPVTVIEMTNNAASNDKELVIFRDSFGSSLSPLLLESYKKVTLIDLRYIPASAVKDYVKFENQDVLFLYSTLILNAATGLRM